MSSSWKEVVLGSRAGRGALAVGSVLERTARQAAGDAYGAVAASFRAGRLLSLSGTPVPAAIAGWNAQRRADIRAGRLDLLGAFARSSQGAAIRREFHGHGRAYAAALKLPRAQDFPEREGDLLVLQPADEGRKGLLLLKYNAAFLRFAALYDVAAVAQRYRFVLEPSTWGYEDAAILAYMGAPTDVLVEAQYDPDYAFIEGTASNLRPVPVGAGDWVDPSVFAPPEGQAREYDLIMVASWQPMKRHALLFAALRTIPDVVRRVALVGYPSGGRTADDVRAEAREAGVTAHLEFFESIPPAEVSHLLSRSRVAVMLSLREGANKALYEALFCNTPVIVSRDNVGVSRRLVNDRTGRWAADAELGDAIRDVVSSPERWRPREWALAHTGYESASRLLDEHLAAVVAQAGETAGPPVFRKCNRPNAQFVRADDRAVAREALAALSVHLRPL